jgi:hypothetical protein
MLSKEPTERPTANECLEHNFFSDSKVDIEQKKAFFSSLKTADLKVSYTADF